MLLEFVKRQSEVVIEMNVYQATGFRTCTLASVRSTRIASSSLEKMHQIYVSIQVLL